LGALKRGIHCGSTLMHRKAASLSCSDNGAKPHFSRAVFHAFNATVLTKPLMSFEEKDILEYGLRTVYRHKAEHVTVGE
jgi:hypothetical protein